jgi:hypothetical protein
MSMLGIIPRAFDDEPSGIATFSQTGGHLDLECYGWLYFSTNMHKRH